MFDTQPSSGQNTLSETAQKMVSLLGWKWLWCAVDAAEIASTVAEVAVKKSYEIIVFPTFTQDNKRVWSLTALENGDYRALVEVGRSEQRAAIVLRGSEPLMRFVPTTSV